MRERERERKKKRKNGRRKESIYESGIVLESGLN